MVTRTITLRPSADISVGHSLSAGSSGYALISEATADNDSTYIYQTLSSTDSSSITSTFRLSGTMPTDPYTVSAVRLYLTGRKGAAGESGAMYFYSGVNTTEVDNDTYCGVAATSSDISSSYKAFQKESTRLADLINQYMTTHNGAFPSVTGKIITTGKKSNSKGASDGFIRVTQIYMEVDCEVDTGQHIFVKENGNWVEYSKVFVKQNGIWVEQADLPSVFDTNTMYLKKT